MKMDVAKKIVSGGHRITSIDLLRGIVMIIMALDHTKDYFHADSLRFEATDLEQTNVILFFTRWITHFCAPVFVFLAGTSSFLSAQQKTKKELSFFLLKRGLWLLFLEVTSPRLMLSPTEIFASTFACDNTCKGEKLCQIKMEVILLPFPHQISITLR